MINKPFLSLGKFFYKGTSIYLIVSFIIGREYHDVSFFFPLFFLSYSFSMNYPLYSTIRLIFINEGFILLFFPAVGQIIVDFSSDPVKFEKIPKV